jgi:hypothetical protein
MQGVRCLIPVPIPVPGTCWAELDLLAMQGVRCSIPVLLDSSARHLLGLSQDLLAMLGVRCSIPVPGTCWGRARFASNAGRQVSDSGARQSDSSRRTTAWQRMATTWQRVATISQIRRIGDARMVVLTPAPLRPYPPHANQCSPHRLQPAFSASFYCASAVSGGSAGSLCTQAPGSLPKTHSHPRTNGSSS